MKNYVRIAHALGVAVCAIPLPAFAQTAPVSVESGDVAGPTVATPPQPQHVETPYMKRFVPENDMWELGLFGGVMFPANNHQLYEPETPLADRQEYKTAGEVGVRFAYFPLTFLGAEAEAALMPSQGEDGSAAGLWALRGHGIVQLPGSSITPFVLLGGGALGAASSSMGNDSDSALHFGGGVKAPLAEHVTIRLDVRDTMTLASEASGGGSAHSPEILLGLSFVPKRTKPDADKDGVLDARDACPFESGPANGCPAPDSDGDKVADDVDECVDVAGIAPTGCPDKDGDTKLDRDDPCPDVAGPLPHGCPEKPCLILDTDADGLTDKFDQCPSEAARTPTGCVIHDQDLDALSDDKDKCPADSETKNGFQDADGCPDVLPETVSKFIGVIRGIEFEGKAAKLKKSSETLLREAAQVFKSYPELKLLITGHTDNQGERDANLKVSRERAEAVKAFLVQEGVAAAQLQTKGAGPDLPLVDNTKPADRPKNQRIEFAFIQ